MKCVIIDDEPLAIEVIENYFQQIEKLSLLAKFHNPVEAIHFLSNHQVDLVFLDIQMPKITGIELVKNLENKPKFIFTTAYPQYALEGFDLDAIDYLVKPIPFVRFLKAVQKAQKIYDLEQQYRNEVPSFIFVRADYENVKIDIRSIVYIEGLKDYLKIYLENIPKPILTLMSFSQILEKLENDSFLRVHRSYIVNTSHMQGMRRGKILIENKFIPIGNTYKDAVIAKLGLQK